MRLSLYVLIFGLVGCATAPRDEVLTLEKQLRQATKERDQAREDYEADILQAFHRTELDHRFPYSGMPRVPDWVSPKAPEPVVLDPCRPDWPGITLTEAAAKFQDCADQKRSQAAGN